MAYPTAAQFAPKPISPIAGLQPAQSISTTQNHPLGMRAHFQDSGTLGYGVIEAIYLKGVASTAAGDIVTYDEVAGTTTRSVAATRGPLAVALAACVASNYGWYAIKGEVPVSTASAGTGAANALLQVTATAGQATVSGTASVKIDNAACKTAQDTPSSGFTQVSLGYPSANGNT